MLQWVYKRPDPCIEYSGWENSKPSKSDIHLILRVGFAVPVTFTSSASSFFFYRNGEKGTQRFGYGGYHNKSKQQQK